jgi:hypothetical protein
MAPKARAAGATLSISPSSQTINVGDKISLTLNLDTGGNAVGSFSIKYYYNNAILNADQINFDGSPYNKSVSDSVSWGTINLNRYILSTTGYTGTAKIATITFSAINTGTCSFSGSSYGTKIYKLGTDEAISTNLSSATITVNSSPTIVIPPTITPTPPVIVVPSIPPLSNRISIKGINYKSSSVNNENLTIKNAGTVPVNTAGWKIKNKKNQSFGLPNYNLNAGSSVTIHTTKAPKLKCKTKITIKRIGKRLKIIRTKTCPKLPEGHIYLSKSRKIFDKKHDKIILTTNTGEQILVKSY